jgi:hypothetical protein
MVVCFSLRTLITGFLNPAAVSLKISMDSLSRGLRADGYEITIPIVVLRVLVLALGTVKL